MMAPPHKAGSSELPGTARSTADGDFGVRLMDEYKILQDKMDKIGGFRTTIKGWSVTAVIAASVAGGATGSLATAIMVSVGLSIMLLFFFRLEYLQVELSRLFGKRARKLEQRFRQIDGKNKRSRALFPVPYIAHEVVEASARKTVLNRFMSRALQSESTLLKKCATVFRISWKADFAFYLVLIVIAFLFPSMARDTAIGRTWKHLVDRVEKIDAPATTSSSGAAEGLE